VQRDPPLEFPRPLAVDGVIRHHVLRGVVKRQARRPGRDGHAFRDLSFPVPQQVARLFVLARLRAFLEPLRVAIVPNPPDAAASGVGPSSFTLSVRLQEPP
jgi:hypothetical protein